jgi:hypothetical protein
MPVLPHGPYLGLGPWNSVPATLAIEGLLYLAGLALYLRSTVPADRVGRSLVILLPALWLA